MRPTLLLTLLFFNVIGFSQEKKQLQFFQTDWGRTDSWFDFCERTQKAGYDGIEVWFPTELQSMLDLKKALEQYNLKVIFLAGTDRSLPFETSLVRYTENLMSLLEFGPVAINCHTGSDFFTFEQNKAFIDAANKLAKENNIPIYHETHRGRFSYNLPDTKKYISTIPDLKLTMDISHWMVVHESLLENQDVELQDIIGRSNHIHARVGHAEGPQVNDPEAPEWQKALDRHMIIWEKVIRTKWAESEKPFTITTEFGPPDYLPTLPYTRVPVADQWKANLFIMKALKERMNIQ